MENWVRQQYDSWDDAFRGQMPAVRRQAVRVADYTRELFLAAQKASFYYDTQQGITEIKNQSADTAYKCGLYHQIAKAMVPPEYQVWQNDFSDEEKAVYLKYTLDGRALIESLQSKLSRSQSKRMDILKIAREKNIPTEMMCKCSEQHMERWNGSGFPKGLKGNDISPIAQIVALAKELDRLSAERKTEHPFDEAMERLVSEKDILWNPVLIDILVKSEEACRKVYEKYIQYTLTVPETVPLLEKRQGRPLGINYRVFIESRKSSVKVYEAVPFFGELESPDDKEGVYDIAELLARADAVDYITSYLFYEATDCLLRLQKCGIAEKGIVFNTIPGFYKGDGRVRFFSHILDDQPVDRSLIYLSVPENVFTEGTKTEKENVAKLSRNGFKMLLCNVHPEKWDVSKLSECGIAHLSLASDAMDAAEYFVKSCISSGIEVFASADTAQQLENLFEMGVSFVGGPAAGKEKTEDEIVREGLIAANR